MLMVSTSTKTSIINFGGNVRRLSQEKLAELSDLSKNSLGAIERGTSSPSIDTLDRIASALEMELSELVKVKSFDL